MGDVYWDDVMIIVVYHGLMMVNDGLGWMMS